MLPLRDDNPTRSFAWVTLAIIVLNFLAFLLWQPTLATGPDAESRRETFFFCHAEIPWEVSHFTSLGDGGAGAREAISKSGILQGSGLTPAEFQAYLAEHCGHKNWLLSVFTAMFLHIGWLHILGNMLFLWVFGNNVEDRVGRIRFLIFYLVAGIAASLAQLATGPNDLIPNLGASGAIAGVLGAYLVMFPRRRVLTLIFFFIITFVYLPAALVLGLWFVLQIFSGVGSLAQHVQSGGTAFWAHIGGFTFGALMALLFFPKEGIGRPPPRRPDLPGRRAHALRRRRRRSGWPAPDDPYRGVRGPGYGFELGGAAGSPPDQWPGQSPPTAEEPPPRGESPPGGSPRRPDIEDP
jgi:membrane associated rhomboid family serine protease